MPADSEGHRYGARVDGASIDELAARYVRPFYLQMMAVNAVRAEPALLADIAAVGTDATASDVVRLLRLAWRERVMGAWFAVRVREPEVTAAVLEALRTSRGSLDAPPLATAAVVLAGPAALNALEQHFAADRANGWGASQLITAAAHHLGGQHRIAALLPAPTAADRDAFSALVLVARRLQAA